MTSAYVVMAVVADVTIPAAVTRDADFAKQLRDKFAEGKLPNALSVGVATFALTRTVEWIIVEAVDADTEKEAIESTLAKAFRRAMKLE